MRQKRSQNDFSDELKAHIALETDRLRAEGLSERDAFEQASKSFGNVGRVEENFYESRRILWLDRFKQDAVFGLRKLRKNKGFTAVAVCTLALGIGGTTAIFTLLHAALLRALPYRDADRIVRVDDTRLQGQSTAGLVGVPRFFDLKARSRSFEALAFYYFDHPTMVSGVALPVPLAGVGVSGDFWNAIGLQPILGRTLNANDDRPHAANVAVISYGAWQQSLGADKSVLGRQVMLDGQPTTIVGVMPPALGYPGRIDIWVPSHFDPAEWNNRHEGTRFINVVGRLKNDVSMAQAQQDLRRVGDQLRREYPATDGLWQFGSESFRDYLYGAWKPALFVLLAASGTLLLIACLNVANLLLSQGTTRAGELALRRALGASPARILLKLFTENALLAMAGGAIGTFTAFLLVHFLGTRLPGRLGALHLELDPPVLAFALAVSLLTSIVFGTAPVLQSGGADLQSSLKLGGRRSGDATHGRVRNIFISVEVALSLVLLVGASLMGESFWNLLKSPLGFQPNHVLSFALKIPYTHNPTSVKQFYSDLQTQIEHLPGVAAVGQITALPMTDWHLRSNFDVDWKPRTTRGDAVNVEDRHVAGNYLATMNIPLIAGRKLMPNDADAKNLPILVNQEFAAQYLPHGNVIGRHLINRFGSFEIVGVIGNVRGTAGSIAAPFSPEVYFPADGDHTGRTFVMRCYGNPDAFLSAIRKMVHQAEPAEALRDVTTLDEKLNESVAQPRFNLGLLCAFALIAIVLACVGVYGVVSYSVAQRVKEIGIRIALGATRAQISSLFIRRALIATVVGLAGGTMVALLGGRLLQSQLYGVPPNHPLTFLVAPLLLLLPVLVASAYPALRGAALNPVEALRRD